jgi:CDGSH-type Zn-finger protein
MSDEAQLNFIEDGPIALSGEIEIVDKEGKIIKTQGKTAFCRCGASENKPFCDGSHIKIGFKAPADLGKS